LDALRKVLLTGKTLANPQVAPALLILVVYTVVLLPLSLLFFRWGYNRVRMEGTTTTY
jgi:hypothetical protein